MHLPALLSVAYVCSVKANLPVDANGASDNTNVQKKKEVALPQSLRPLLARE